MGSLMDVLYWVLIGAACVAGLLALLAFVGCFLRRSHVVSRSILVKAPPETVWAVITDYTAAPTWHPELKTAERLPDRNGHELWRDTDKRGYAMSLETVECVPPHRLVRAIADEGGPFSGQWEFELTTVEDGTRVELTERGQIPNPFFRLMFRMFMTPTWYVELYLMALGARMGAEHLTRK